MEAGCVASRSSATVGIDELRDGPPGAGLVEREVLEDREAVRPGVGRAHDGLRELLVAEPEVGRRARQPVPAQARVEPRRQILVAAQERREEARRARQLAV